MKVNKEKEALITQEYLKEILDYNPDTGIFTWKIRPSQIKHIGNIAGTLNKRGYIRINVNKKSYLAHRLVLLYMTGSWPIDMVDHKDNNKSNNCFDNLRECDNKFNKQNQNKPQKNNHSTSTMCGVTFREDSKKWRVMLRINRILINFGQYDTQEEAEKVCLENRKKYFEGVI